MNKKVLIIGLIVVFLLGGGIWLLTQNETPNQINNSEDAVEEENNTENSVGSIKDNSNEENNIDMGKESEDKLVIYFFWGNGCPHCAEEKSFLESLEEKHSELEVKMYETYKNKENAEFFNEVAKAYGISAQGVPATFIGDFEPIVGYSSDQTTGKEIEDQIKECIEDGCINPYEKL
ncbi:MAG: glutaredoxin family protein [Minisyncoccales bacterium]